MNKKPRCILYISVFILYFGDLFFLCFKENKYTSNCSNGPYSNRCCNSIETFI